VTPWVQRLLIANVVMFFLQQTVPGVTGLLAFVPAYALMQPWTMVTYMFLHGGFTHILFNMLGLYFLGPRVESRLGSERFFVLYMVSGIAGALLSFVFARHAVIVGASAAVMGVMFAYARFWPRDKFLFWYVIPIEARWLVLGYAAWSVFSGYRGSQGGVADFAHLGGFVGAFLYLQFIGRNAAGKKWQRQVTAAPPSRAIADWSKVDRSSIHEVNRDEVNRILDKISASGVASLTPAERLFLSNFVPADDRKPIN
jgi:membrane associated rhomboid family serine protease